MNLSIPVGPFRLDRRIGIGGAGEVWSGLHQNQGIPVAVKVITSSRARDPRYRDAFRNEVRMMAGLEHPGVVMVLDYGTIDERAERASDGRMVAGSPYLAMELAELGSLRHAPLPSSFEELRAQLLWLLDILAHAHAKGVIHRDLKPGNILRFAEPATPGDSSGASQLRLTDFGLGHTREMADKWMRGTSGTPVFMAPEQFRGRWRKFGPWTDLYALGCTAFALACGGLPYRGTQVMQLMEMHLSDPIPRLMPRVPVPDEFEPWVRRLMHKEPEGRFQRAADAAYALAIMPGAEGETTGAPVTRVFDAAHTLQRSWPTQGRVGAVVDVDNMAPRRVPPFPPTYRTLVPARHNMQLVGAGLGLYGIRSIPLIGRDEQRTALWQALGRAREHGGVEAIVLRGQAGAGKSRLAQWLCERADAVGSGIVLRATHTPEGGPGDGLPRMVESALGCGGLSRHEMRAHVQAWLETHGGAEDDREADRVVELMWPSNDPSQGNRALRFAEANERYALLHRLFRAAGAPQEEGSASRPVVLWLDDVQWGRDALGLVRYLLGRTHASPRPILMVCTVREEALPTRPVESEMLDAVCEVDKATLVQVDALDASERRSLVQELLLLEGEVATMVEERTAGNPLFAVQLVGDWVQRGVLVPGETGFQLRAGERAELPDDIHELWNRRIDRVLDGLGEDARVALELAALMGSDVSLAEWQGASRVAGLRVPRDLVSTLVERRLAVARDQGWAFAHGMLRESLERSAQEHGRSQHLHRACATTLRIRLDVAPQPGVNERLGKHLMRGEQYDEALEPLLAGALERRAMSDYAGALELLTLRREVADTLELPPSDERRGRGAVVRADLLVGQGELAEAERTAMRIIRDGERYHWDGLLPGALRHAASAAAKLGRLADAERRLEQAVAKGEGHKDELETAQAIQFLSDVQRMQGHHEQAAASARRALGRFAAMEDVRGQATSVIGLAGIHRVLGELEEVERYAREAVRLFELSGSRFGKASAINTLGEVLRMRGQLDEAVEVYQQAEQAFRDLGSPEYVVPVLNLGLVHNALGQWEQAQEALEDVLFAMVDAGRKGLEGLVHALLLPSAAALRDWEAWDIHIDAAQTLLGETGLSDPDIVAAAEQGAELAQQAPDWERAMTAFDLAITQAERIGKGDVLASLMRKRDIWLQEAPTLR